MGVIIALEGKENSGKSSTINLLISKIISELAIDKIEKHHDWRDKTYVFHINRKTVMVTTMGDHNKYLENQLINVSQVHHDNCDVIVYAKRLGEDFNCIETLIKSGKYNQVIVDKKDGQNKNDIRNKIVYTDFDGKNKTVPIIIGNSIYHDLDSLSRLFNELKKYI